MTINNKKSYKKIVENLQTAFTDNPEAAKADFFASSKLISGLRCESTSRDFTTIIDEPESLGGSNLGPSPVELALSALGACQEITYRLYADKLGIPLEKIEIDLSGNLDFKGFLALDDNIRPGYLGINVTVNIESTASDAEIDKLKDIVNAHCPVLDLFSNKTPVDISVSRKSSKFPTERLNVA